MWSIRPDPEDSDIVDIWRFLVEEDEAGERLDQLIASRDVGTTRSQIQRLIERGLARVDGEPARSSKRLRPGQQVEVEIPAPEPLSARPEEMPLDIRFEDEALLVVNKPQGLVVHPAPGHPRGTLVNGLLFGRTAAGGDPLRPGIVHRLDKDTSGLMVVAKRQDVHADLARQFHQRSVERRYSVLVAGDPPPRGEWRTLHGRLAGDRRKFSSRVRRGKPAISFFERLESFEGAALLSVSLGTGRTHQVRVHCHDAGFGVLGDPWYGPKKIGGRLLELHRGLPGQALHAGLLGFVHPLGGERLSFSSDPPPPFAAALAALRERT